MQSHKNISLDAESPIWHGNNVHIGRYQREPRDVYEKRLQLLIPDDDEEFKANFLSVCKLTAKQKIHIRRYLLVERYGISVTQCESCQGFDVPCRIHYSEHRCASCIAAYRDCSHRGTWADPKSPVFSTTMVAAPSNLAGRDNERRRDLLGCNGFARAFRATQQIPAEVLANKLNEVAEGMNKFHIAMPDENIDKASVLTPSHVAIDYHSLNGQSVAKPSVVEAKKDFPKLQLGFRGAPDGFPKLQATAVKPKREKREKLCSKAGIKKSRNEGKSRKANGSKKGRKKTYSGKEFDYESAFSEAASGATTGYNTDYNTEYSTDCSGVSGYGPTADDGDDSTGSLTPTKASKRSHRMFA
ncbi:hypothetical protein TWF506_004820 [Arthrobotrys conoides]|uniref:Uncharacterized protein n=1 Tax=Arthrobotrys conoides TaxID=74498 RepID=A0AAN8RZ90_9PEZI